MFDLFGKQSQRAKELMFSDFQIIDVQRLKDADLVMHNLAGLVNFVLKHHAAKDFADNIRQLMPFLQMIESLSASTYDEIVLTFVLNHLDESHIEEFIEMAQHQLSGQVKKKTISIGDMFREEGIQKGIQKGILEGRKAEAKLLAKRMLQANPL